MMRFGARLSMVTEIQILGDNRLWTWKLHINDMDTETASQITNKVGCHSGPNGLDSEWKNRKGKM